MTFFGHKETVFTDESLELHFWKQRRQYNKYHNESTKYTKEATFLRTDAFPEKADFCSLLPESLVSPFQSPLVKQSCPVSTKSKRGRNCLVSIYHPVMRTVITGPTSVTAAAASAGVSIVMATRWPAHAPMALQTAAWFWSLLETSAAETRCSLTTMKIPLSSTTRPGWMTRTMKMRMTMTTQMNICRNFQKENKKRKWENCLFGQTARF